MTAATEDRWLTNQDLADRYQTPLESIRHWRKTGYGPEGVLIGRRVLYRESVVAAWEKAKEAEQAAS